MIKNIWAIECFASLTVYQRKKCDKIFNLRAEHPESDEHQEGTDDCPGSVCLTVAGLLTGISRSRNIRGKEAKSLGRFSQDGTLLLKYTTSTAMRLTGWHCQVYHLGVQYSTPWWHQILEIILCQVCVLYMTFRLCLYQEGRPWNLSKLKERSENCLHSEL